MSNNTNYLCSDIGGLHLTRNFSFVLFFALSYALYLVKTYMTIKGQALEKLLHLLMSE